MKENCETSQKMSPGKKLLIKIGVIFGFFALFIGLCFAFATNDLRNGKVTFDLNINKNNTQLVQDNVNDLNSFKVYFDNYVKNLNSYKDNDYYGVNSYKETNDKYIVSLSTRRVDKLENLGNIKYGKSETFFVNDTTNEKLFSDIYEGRIRNEMTRKYQDGSSASFNFGGDYTEINNIGLRIVDATNKSNKIVKKDVVSTISKKGNFIIYFELVDFKLADSLSFGVYGNVKYYSNVRNNNDESLNENIKIDGSRITINPIEMTGIKSVLGSEEETTTNLFVGYFVYSQNLSPILISLIITGSLLVLLALYFLIFKGYAKKIFSKHTLLKIHKFRYLYCLIIPALVLLILFRYIPDIYLSASFMEYDLLDGLSSEFVGGKYFINIFLAKNTADMYRIFRNTIFISLIRIASNIPFILFLAVVINSMKNKKAKTVFQGISLIPYFLSWVAIGGVFYSLLNSETGLINRLLSLTTDIYSISEPWWALLSLSSLYKGMGWSAIIYIAGMCQIDTGLYEAAKIDGCNKFRQATNVTIPGIMPIVALQLILDISNVMKDNYDQVLAMISGSQSPEIQETVDVVGRIAYTSLRDGNFGSATAIGLIQSVIGCLLVIIANRIVKKTDNEGIM